MVVYKPPTTAEAPKGFRIFLLNKMNLGTIVDVRRTLSEKEIDRYDRVGSFPDEEMSSCHASLMTNATTDATGDISKRRPQ